MNKRREKNQVKEPKPAFPSFPNPGQTRNVLCTTPEKARDMLNYWRVIHQIGSALLLSALCYLLSPCAAQAQLTIGPLNWSGNTPICFAGQGVTNKGCPGPNISSNVAWFCTSARGLGAPRVTWLSFSSDIAANNLQVYACTNQCFITNAGASGTNQLWMDTTCFFSNDVIVIRSLANDTYQRAVVTNVSASQMGIWPSAGFATTNGDLVYQMQPLYTLNSLAAGTTNYNAYGSIAGREGLPLLLDIGYSNNASIKACIGDYIPRR